MAKTTTKGTCPACFRAIALTSDGKVGRHGWSEQGGRRVGEYHRAWHTGSCFGAGWLPFEVSPAGTTAYVTEVLFPFALGRVTRLEVLATRPALFEIRTAYARGEGWGERVECPYTVRYLPTGTERAVAEYDRKLAAEVSTETTQLERASADGATLLEAVRTWAPAEVKKVEKKGPIMHALSATNARFTACGRRRVALMGGRLVAHVAEGDAVTCPKCLERRSAPAA